MAAVAAYHQDTSRPTGMLQPPEFTGSVSSRSEGSIGGETVDTVASDEVTVIAGKKFRRPDLLSQGLFHAAANPAAIDVNQTLTPSLAGEPPSIVQVLTSRASSPGSRASASSSRRSGSPSVRSVRSVRSEGSTGVRGPRYAVQDEGMLSTVPDTPTSERSQLEDAPEPVDNPGRHYIRTSGAMDAAALKFQHRVSGRAAAPQGLPREASVMSAKSVAPAPHPAQLRRQRLRARKIQIVLRDRLKKLRKTNPDVPVPPEDADEEELKFLVSYYASASISESKVNAMRIILKGASGVAVALLSWAGIRLPSAGAKFLLWLDDPKNEPALEKLARKYLTGFAAGPEMMVALAFVVMVAGDMSETYMGVNVVDIWKDIRSNQKNKGAMSSILQSVASHLGKDGEGISSILKTIGLENLDLGGMLGSFMGGRSEPSETTLTADEASVGEVEADLNFD